MGIYESRLSMIKALKSKFAFFCHSCIVSLRHLTVLPKLSPCYVAQADLKLTPHLPVSTLPSFSIVSLRVKIFSWLSNVISIDRARNSSKRTRSNSKIELS